MGAPQSVLDAMADAETLRLFVFERESWADPSAARLRRALVPVCTVERITCSEIAHAALNAIPGLRGGACARREAYDAGARPAAIALINCWCDRCSERTFRTLHPAPLRRPQEPIRVPPIQADATPEESHHMAAALALLVGGGHSPLRPDLQDHPLFAFGLALLLLFGSVLTIVAIRMLTGERSLLGTLRCAYRGAHDPVRHPIGGFRCTACGLAGWTLHDLGFDSIDYVTPPVLQEYRAQVRDTSRPSAVLDHRYYRRASGGRS